MIRRAVASLALALAAAAAAVSPAAPATAGVVQPTILVPAAGTAELVVPATAGLWYGWSDGAHGSDWRFEPFADCGGAAHVVTFTNTADRTIRSKYYPAEDVPEGRITVKGTSTALSVTVACDA